MNPFEYTLDPNAYPKIGAYPGREAGARVDKAGDHCLNFYKTGSQVRFVASYSGDRGYNGLNGVMSLPLKTAREFLQKALDSLPEVETVQVTVRTLRDGSEDLWFETEAGKWVCGGLDEGTYRDESTGVTLEYIAREYGIEAGGFRTQELTIEVR